MPQRLSDHLPRHVDLAVLGLKDGVREIRHRIRAHRPVPVDAGLRAWRGFPRPPLPADPVRHALAAFDDAFSLAERIALGAVRSGNTDETRVASLEHYFGSGQAAQDGARRAFRRDFYAAAKTSAATLGTNADSLREQGIARVWQRVREDIGGSLPRSRQKDTPRPTTNRVAGHCASLLLAFLEEDAATGGDRIGEVDRTTTFFAAPVLASGLVTLGRQAPPGSDFPSPCLAAVEARRERLVHALAGKDAQTELAREMAFLLRHLP
jgi:hypothetical protein